MLNQVVLTGNLRDDPSTHYTPEGLAIIHFFQVAQTMHNIVVDRETARRIAEYLTEPLPILLENYSDEEGKSNSGSPQDSDVNIKY